MKRLVVWGARDSLDSIRHVWRAYHQNANKMGVPTIWVNDEPASNANIHYGDVILAADVTAKHLDYRSGVDYVLHNFDGSSPLCQMLEMHPEHLLRLQVWTTSATGEDWDAYRQFDLEGRTLFQPWGSDLLAEEFYDPVYEPMSREVAFVGAIWSDQYQGTELGNEDAIRELRLACSANGLQFKHYTHVSDAENIAIVRAARLAPAFAGNWQVRNNYLPCRYFKNAAYGVLAFGNVECANWLLDIGFGNGSIAETLDRVLSLKRGPYLELVREQQRVVARYTYRESIESIARALREIKA